MRRTLFGNPEVINSDLEVDTHALMMPGQASSAAARPSQDVLRAKAGSPSWQRPSEAICGSGCASHKRMIVMHNRAGRKRNSGSVSNDARGVATLTWPRAGWGLGWPCMDPRDLCKDHRPCDVELRGLNEAPVN